MSCGRESDETAQPNDQPKASDNTLTVLENSNAGSDNQIDVSENDKIGNDGGAEDNYNLATIALNGIVTEIKDGIFEYIPNADFSGSDSFTYTLSDKDGDQDNAKVSVTVTPVEDGLTAEDFENIDPTLPSFVSLDNTTPEGKKWVKFEEMSDEFETWDGTKWFKSTWNYPAPVFMSKSADNSGVTDGHLWIRATLNESNVEDRWFQTARIHSRTKTSYPMYTEARVKAAYISAFTTYWLNNGNSTDRDEIDIIENNPKPSCDCQPDFPLRMNSQYFHADANEQPVVIRDEDNYMNTNLSDANPLKGVKWNDDYHTFGVWWKDEKHIQFYLDGEPAGSVEVGHDRSGQTYENRYFTRDLEIIFDLWTNEANWLGGLPEKTELSNAINSTMLVDWVRTWKLEDK
ncbi:Ig-like domain-containing protein [Limibacter armeniacum]|uniref:Ig-like domain-containing protein n=1 Tax=Limibacter armeniacum TaxID=466084 RepID=UPI002FE6A2B7